MNFKKGFTLMELLVVVGIVAVLSTVVMAALNNARNKSSDVGVKSNLANAVRQGEILYNTRTANRDTYRSACTVGIVDGAQGIGEMVLAAARAYGLVSVGYNNSPAASVSVATCNDSDSAWAAEVPLRTAGQVWCVDSTGKSKQESVTIGATTACQ